MNWISIAKDLPLHGKTQTTCPENCGSGEKLSVNHSIKSYWCNCYRCGYTDSEFKGKQTLTELTRIQQLNEAAESLELTLELPSDFTQELPRHARAWLFKAGITETTWRAYNIGYSKTLDRVVLPVYDTKGSLEWYQCRALQQGQKPKYLQPSRDRSKIMFRSKGVGNDLSRAVIVEDILSAVRVGAFVDTYSLLGTKITTEQAAGLRQYKKIITWLDPDKAGRVGAYNIRKTLGLITDVGNISTELDPKELSNKEIKEKLCQ